MLKIEWNPAQRRFAVNQRILYLIMAVILFFAFYVSFFGEDVFKGDNGKIYKSIELVGSDAETILANMYTCDNKFQGEQPHQPDQKGQR